jgi:hypothetical protein
MNLRELLQTAIWSKETSRKFLGGISCLLMVALIGSCAWSFISRRWMTPREHQMARTALVELASLDDTDSASKEDFAAKARLAAIRMDAAVNAALTVRDQQVVGELMHYQLLIITNRLLIAKKTASLPVGAVLNSVGSENRSSLRAKLQEELD